jgi:hypothetical protein
MVLKTGYILPAQNYVARMNTLETGLANNKVRLLASTASVETPKVSVPVVATQPATTTIYQNTPIVSRNVVLQEMNAQTPTSVSQTPLTPSFMPIVATRLAAQKGDTDLVRELKSKLQLPTAGLTSAQARREREQMSKEDVNIKPTFADMVLKGQQAQEPSSNTSTTASLTNLSTTAIPDSSIISKDQQDAYAEANKFIGPLDEDSFMFLIKQLSKKRIPVYLTADKRKNAQFKVPIIQENGKVIPRGIGSRSTKDATYDRAWESYKRSPDDFVTEMKSYILQEFGVSGSGLHKRGGTLLQYYHRNAPNFGNLFLNEKELKRGNLSISQPFSKSYVLHQKNISPLLKKMIFDIANTLEFDKQDYYNLDGEEKRIIEKIIRAQKNMKEMNIKKLIDDDDHKMKKRLQILVGQINAGNQSHLVKKEMRQLLKNLFDNRAISLYKYNQAIKSLDSI